MPFHDHVSALRTIAVSIARLEDVIHTRMVDFGDPDKREGQVNAVLDAMEQSEISSAMPQPGEEPRDNPQETSPLGLQEGLLRASSPKKRSGGQPGNSNAWKHGFYARAFTPAEKALLQGGEADQLRHEETLIRLLILRTWRSLRTVRSTLTYQEYLFTNRSICYAVYVIARLQRARRRLFGDQTDLEKDIQLGIEQACADLGILDYLHQQVKK